MASAATIVGSTGSLAFSGTNSVSPSFGQATTAGNFLVGVVDVNTNNAITVTGPTGWVQAGFIASGTNLQSAVWYKSNCGAGETAPTFNATSATIFRAALAEFSGLPANPSFQVGTVTGVASPQAVTCSQVDSTSYNLIVSCGAWRNVTNTSGTFSDLFGDSTTGTGVLVDNGSTSTGNHVRAAYDSISSGGISADTVTQSFAGGVAACALVIVSFQANKLFRTTSPNRQQTTGNWLKGIMGTWVIKQINNLGDLSASDLTTALPFANLAGFSARIAWSAITSDGITFDMSFANSCLATAQANNLPLVLRVMGGQFCPGSTVGGGNTLFNSAGVNAFQSNGSGTPPTNQWIPCPFNADGSPNTLYEGFYNTLASQLAIWARSKGVQPGGYPQPGLPLVPMVVMPWYSYGTSEPYGDAASGGAIPGGEIFAATGFSTTAVDTAYRRLVDIFAPYSGPDLMFQVALSGQGGSAGLSRLDSVCNAEMVAHPNAKYLSIGGTNWNGGQTSPVTPVGLMFNQPISQDLDQRRRSFENPSATAIQAQRAGDQDWTVCYEMIGSYGIDFAEVYSFSFKVGVGQPSTTQANINNLIVEIAKFKGVNVGRTTNAGRVINSGRLPN